MPDPSSLAGKLILGFVQLRLQLPSDLRGLFAVCRALHLELLPTRARA